MKYLLAAMASLVTLTTSANQALTINVPQLHYQIANRAVLQAIDECTKKGFKVSAAVIDRNGNLISFIRHPLAGPHTIKTSQKKAFTAASLQSPTGLQLQKERPDLNFAPGIVLIQGAQPINIAGQYYGGIAVAGADTKTDESSAIKGLELINNALEFAD